MGHIVEDSSEMTLRWKDIALSWKVCTSRIDQIEARKVILESYLLSAEMFSNGDRIVGPSISHGLVPFDSRVIGDYHAESALNETHSGYYAS